MDIFRYYELYLIGTMNKHPLMICHLAQVVPVISPDLVCCPKYPFKLFSSDKNEGIGILRRHRQGYWTAHSHTADGLFPLASVAQPVQTDPIRNDATPSLVLKKLVVC